MNADQKKTLDLRGLADAERDARINEAVAGLHGWAKSVVTGKMEGHPWMNEPPSYATSCDAVMPLLEKYAIRIDRYDLDDIPEEIRWKVTVLTDGIFAAHGPTFPLAACIALLRSNGLEVLT